MYRTCYDTGMSQDPSKHGFHLLEKLRHRKDRHRQRSRLYRSGFVVFGVGAVLAGLLLLILPGPGLVVIAIGLYFLALEFDWAERLLEWALKHADRGVQTPFGRSVARVVRKRPRLTAAFLAIVTTALLVLTISLWKPELYSGL